MTGVAPINFAIPDRGRKVEMIYVENITVGQRQRALSESGVATLTTSMESIGLRTPISVAVRDDGQEIVLLTGAHRLEAARRLGWEKIECIVYYDGDEIDAQLWEIAENLHRSGLTKEQRDEHIRRYASLLAARKSKPTQFAWVLEKGGRGKTSVATQVAKETGISADTVRRALNPDRIAAEKARREAEKAEERAEAEQRAAEVTAGLPEETRQMIEQQKARREAAKASADIDQMLAELEELREANTALEQENAELKAEVGKFASMKVLFDKGGYEAVIAAKDEEIRVLETRVYRESEDKASWARSSNYWKEEARKLGWTKDEIIAVTEEDMRNV
ncbi:hypothetical protein EMQ25_05615 [Arsenicitalea aurantiaca]|uniref:ParB-like N-terminal domain-containing protein n=1 Tax=Arsenicitalea aurantiaca TaxID=1783274 RepID=A0A433XEZ2_9HYPH|nr:ParB N-terminal domain-containing protein [Arsenicitalea aurantiaca]RUT32626.1 hypothetical protein EMQ25_05615 [Arsenicitalea aurantiaca]